MSSAAEILVIILAVVLSVFLIVAIVLAIYLIRLSAEIRKVAQSASRTADHIESAVSDATRLLSPVFIANLFGQAFKKFTKKRR